MNKPLILVVEDDAPIRNLITTTLKTQDYKYIAAATASEALQQATIHAPDVMLLDLGLPDLDGIEVIRRIRSWSAMPIIVISARSEDSDKIEALDSGADDYLTKPFSVEELLARLRVTFRRISMLQNAAGCSVAVYPDAYRHWIQDAEGVKRFSRKRYNKNSGKVWSLPCPSLNFDLAKLCGDGFYPIAFAMRLLSLAFFYAK